MSGLSFEGDSEENSRGTHGVSLMTWWIQKAGSAIASLGSH